MFIGQELMKAVDGEIQLPRWGRAAQAARDHKALMLNAIAKANMLDTENVVAFYFGANRQARKDTIADASDRFRAIIASLMKACSELEGTVHTLSDNAGNTTRLASVVASASEDASNNVQSVWCGFSRPSLGHWFAISQHRLLEVCHLFPHPPKQRAQGMPGARCAR
jgi:hypothetical protein